MATTQDKTHHGEEQDHEESDRPLKRARTEEIGAGDDGLDEELGDEEPQVVTDEVKASDLYLDTVRPISCFSRRKEIR